METHLERGPSKRIVLLEVGYLSPSVMGAHLWWGPSGKAAHLKGVPSMMLPISDGSPYRKCDMEQICDGGSNGTRPICDLAHLRLGERGQSVMLAHLEGYLLTCFLVWSSSLRALWQRWQRNLFRQCLLALPLVVWRGESCPTDCWSQLFFGQCNQGSAAHLVCTWGACRELLWRFLPCSR